MDGAGSRVASAVRRAERGDCSRDDALRAVDPAEVEALLHAQMTATEAGPVLAGGTPASPGAGVGQAWFSADAAADAADRGVPVVLVSAETTPADVHGLAVAEAVVTSRGGMASHAAVVARGWGTPAVVGADLEIGEHHCAGNGIVVREGDVVAVDGTTGQVTVGAPTVTAADPPPEFHTLLGWADQARAGRVAVLANADTAAEAALARRWGAEGVGLCRIEHLFIQGPGLAVLRRVLAAADADQESPALADLATLLRDELVELLAAMDGLPVTVRLLDAPQHEFLPDGPDQERNPMLGVRGVRLGVLRPALYAAQVGAVVDAVAERRRCGGDPRARVMVPLAATGTELVEARRWLARAELPLGAMIETPRAAVVAADLAVEADFLSFGTNDLTQLTYGFSRDDVTAHLLPAYREQGLLDADPFETLDIGGVGSLMGLAVEAARRANPGINIGVCGEHGGEPRSIAWFCANGFDAVSCSPYRVPVLRLAAARALASLPLT